MFHSQRLSLSFTFVNDKFAQALSRLVDGIIEF